MWSGVSPGYPADQRPEEPPGLAPGPCASLGCYAETGIFGNPKAALRGRGSAKTVSATAFLIGGKMQRATSFRSTRGRRKTLRQGQIRSGLGTPLPQTFDGRSDQLYRIAWPMDGKVRQTATAVNLRLGRFRPCPECPGSGRNGFTERLSLTSVL